MRSPGKRFSEAESKPSNFAPKTTDLGPASLKRFPRTPRISKLRPQTLDPYGQLQKMGGQISANTKFISCYCLSSFLITFCVFFMLFHDNAPAQQDSTRILIVANDMQRSTDKVRADRDSMHATDRCMHATARHQTSNPTTGLEIWRQDEGCIYLPISEVPYL